MADRPTFNWWMKASGPSLFKPVLNALIADFKTTFKTHMSDNDTHGAHVLFEVSDSGFQLEEANSMQDNQFHPVTCEGAGEVTCEHGHIPILFFATLKQRVGEVSGLSEKLTFCNEQGEVIQLSDWSELKNELNRLGIHSDTIRSDAEAIGFVEAIIHLDQIESDKPSFFF